jgi:hypothetical protein
MEDRLAPAEADAAALRTETESRPADFRAGAGMHFELRGAPPGRRAGTARRPYFLREARFDM